MTEEIQRHSDLSPVTEGVADGANPLLRVLVTCPDDPTFQPREIEIDAHLLKVIEDNAAELQPLEHGSYITIEGRLGSLNPEGRVRWAAQELAGAVSAARTAGYHVEPANLLPTIATLTISETAAVGG